VSQFRLVLLLLRSLRVLQ